MLASARCTRRQHEGVDAGKFSLPVRAGLACIGKYKSYSVSLRDQVRRRRFTGDTGPSGKLADFVKGADILVSEALAIDEIRGRMQRAGQWQKLSETERAGWEMHMSQEHITPSRPANLQPMLALRRSSSSHLSASGIDNDDYGRFVERAATTFKGRIVAAKDLMEFSP